MWIWMLAGCGDLTVEGLGATFANRGLWVEETRRGDPDLSRHHFVLADEPVSCDDLREHPDPEVYGSTCAEELAFFQQWAETPRSRSTAWLELSLWDTRLEGRSQAELPPETGHYGYFDPNVEPFVGRTGQGFEASLDLHEDNPYEIALSFTEADCEGGESPTSTILQAFAETGSRASFRFSGSIRLEVRDDRVDARLRVQASDEDGSGVVRGDVQLDYCEIPVP
ncbi:MAG: hypothetical protein R3F61_32995 [Myxococcota bacterium]